MDKFLNYVTEYLSNVDMINLVLFSIIVILSVIIFMIFVSFVLQKKDPNKALSDLNEKLSKPSGEATEIYQQDIFTPTKPKKAKDKKKEAENSADTNASDSLSGHEILNIERIYNDMLIGNKENLICSMVIQCNGINFFLMSDEEKFQIEKTFSQFMNTVKFPIQIYIQTRTVLYDDISESQMEKQQEYEQSLKDLVDKLNTVETSSKKTDSSLPALLLEIKSKQKLYEYFKALRDQIARIRRTNAILQNNYYIVLNYFNIEPTTDKSILKNNASLDKAREVLWEKSQYLISGVKTCGVEANVLNSKKLAEMVCSSFLCEQEHILKLQDSIENGFIKMTSSISENSN